MDSEIWYHFTKTLQIYPQYQAEIIHFYWFKQLLQHCKDVPQYGDKTYKRIFSLNIRKSKGTPSFIKLCTIPFQPFLILELSYVHFPWSIFFVDFTNETCIKYSMAHQACKVVTTYTQKISLWNVLFIIIHARPPHIGGMNNGVQSNFSTFESKQWEQIEYLNEIILII